MSYSIRDRAQRKIVQATNNIETAVKYLAEVAETYQELHPEVSEPCEMIALYLIHGQELLHNLRQQF